MHGIQDRSPLWSHKKGKINDKTCDAPAFCPGAQSCSREEKQKPKRAQSVWTEEKGLALQKAGAPGSPGRMREEVRTCDLHGAPRRVLGGDGALCAHGETRRAPAEDRRTEWRHQRLAKLEVRGADRTSDETSLRIPTTEGGPQKATPQRGLTSLRVTPEVDLLHDIIKLS